MAGFTTIIVISKTRKH